MASHGRDLAKFLAGFAANETVGHWWLGIWGRDLLPMKIGGFTFTNTFNMVSMIAWPILLAFLVYWGWFHQPKADTTSMPHTLRPT